VAQVERQHKLKVDEGVSRRQYNFLTRRQSTRLTTETVQGTSLALQSVDDIQRSDGLALGVLGVSDGIANDRLEEGLKDTTSLFVDHYSTDRSVQYPTQVKGRQHTGRDTLDTTTACETADSGLGDTLNVVTQDLAVTLGAALAETFATFTTCEKTRLAHRSIMMQCSGG
jgi:hypothetical protein